MIQGTTSDAGKSVLVAAIGRILARAGIRVAPFKPQNMALNSAVTAGGGEIGRAQAVQALACGVAPHVDMNPVLLKPNSDTGAQVIVLGKAMGNLEAWGYHKKKPSLLPEVLAAHARLQSRYDAVIVEGAGSPAEINLREGDIANMGFAEEADCPVVIVGDIDRGGVYAHLMGTYECLSDSEKSRIQGFVINKFRGDESLLAPANDWLLEKTGKPVLAVIPYVPDLTIEAEDAIDIYQNNKSANALNITVIVTPRISNHTDFDALRLHPNVNLQFIRSPQKLPATDVLIIPGSKNVIADCQWLKAEGWHTAIEKHLRYGGKLVGICGGFQMLGDVITDPKGIEGPAGNQCQGLGLLAMQTELAAEKILRNVTGICQTSNATVAGYEIHAGRSSGAALAKPAFMLNSDDSTYPDGAMSHDGQVMGTYLHGVFDSAEYLAHFLNWCGLVESESFDYQAYRLAEIDRLADVVAAAWPIEEINKLLSME